MYQLEDYLGEILHGPFILLSEIVDNHTVFIFLRKSFLQPTVGVLF